MASASVNVASSEPLSPMMELVDLTAAPSSAPLGAASATPSEPSSLSSSLFAGAIGSYVGGTFLCLLLSKLFALAWKDERLKTLRPVGSFLDRSKLSVPRPSEIVSRLRRNVAYFQSNYLLVFLVLCLYSALTAPTFLIALIIVALLWLYGWRWRQTAVHVRGYALPEWLVAGALGLVTLFLFYFTSATDVVFWLLIVTLAFVFLHALLYTPEPEDEFGFGADTSTAATTPQSTALGFV